MDHWRATISGNRRIRRKNWWVWRFLHLLFTALTSARSSSLFCWTRSLCLAAERLFGRAVVFQERSTQGLTSYSHRFTNWIKILSKIAVFPFQVGLCWACREESLQIGGCTKLWGAPPPPLLNVYHGLNFGQKSNSETYLWKHCVCPPILMYLTVQPH